jgi:NADH:ubiquinone oxidoreductase subunit 4 (subunit M)
MSGREVTIRDVVFRDIKTTTVTQMRDVHIRDKIIKDCILGSPLTVGMFSSRIVSCLHPSIGYEEIVKTSSSIIY